MEDNMRSLVPIKYLMTANDWKMIWREEKIKKECAARRKIKGLNPTAHKIIWDQIKITTASVENSWQK